MSGFFGAKATTVGLWLMLVALALTNVLLLRQNLQLRAALEKKTPSLLRQGQAAAPFTARGLRGESFDVKFDGRGPKRVLLYFTPSCPYCREQFAYWRELLGQADPGRFEVIGLASESEDRARLEEYLRVVGCGPDSSTPMRVAVVPDEVRERYKLSVTPITLIVDNEGKVERVWSRRWDAAALASAGAAFGFDFTQSGTARAGAP